MFITNIQLTANDAYKQPMTLSRQASYISKTTYKPYKPCKVSHTDLVFGFVSG